MKIKWGWNDGYVSNRPDCTLNIDDSELDGMSEVAIEEMVDEIVGDRFHDRVTYWWKRVEPTEPT